MRKNYNLRVFWLKKEIAVTNIFSTCVGFISSACNLVFTQIQNLFFFLFFPEYKFFILQKKMVVTHAHIDAINRYLQTTVGREKLCRFIQYFARFYVFYLFRNDAPKATIQRWNDLKTHIGNARKFYRFLKPIEFAQVGVKSLSIRDEVLRLTAVGKQAGMFVYYLTEAFVLVSCSRNDRSEYS
jgi:hypothetical protein